MQELVRDLLGTAVQELVYLPGHYQNQNQSFHACLNYDLEFSLINLYVLSSSLTLNLKLYYFLAGRYVTLGSTRNSEIQW